MSNEYWVYLGVPDSTDLDLLAPAGEGDLERRALLLPKLPLWSSNISTFEETVSFKIDFSER